MNTYAVHSKPLVDMLCHKDIDCWRWRTGKQVEDSTEDMAVELEFAL